MQSSPKKDTDKEYIRLGLRIVGDFGATLAVPVVVFVIIGQWLDNKYQHVYLFTAIAFVLAALTSARMIYKKAKQYDKLYKDIERK